MKKIVASSFSKHGIGVRTRMIEALEEFLIFNAGKLKKAILSSLDSFYTTQEGRAAHPNPLSVEGP